MLRLSASLPIAFKSEVTLDRMMVANVIKLLFCFQHWQRKISFWFATGGAGFCLSRSLALKMKPLARYFPLHSY